MTEGRFFTAIQSPKTIIFRTAPQKTIEVSLLVSHEMPSEFYLINFTVQVTRILTTTLKDVVIANYFFAAAVNEGNQKSKNPTKVQSLYFGIRVRCS